MARFFGIHQRTLRKRLHADGTHLQKLVDQTRFGLARQLLRDTELPVMEIAAALRFARDALGLVIEGSAAVGVAFARARARHFDGDLVVLLTGRNVDGDGLAA